MSTADDSVLDYGRSAPVSYIKDIPVTGGDQPYITPRQQGTGQQRGTQTISGRLTIVDPTTGKTILIMGYSPGAF